MALETAQYIDQLNSNNPVTGDDVNQGANHLRLIKACLLATFSGFTGAAITATEAQINAAASAIANGVSILSDSGVTFSTNTKDGLLNPAAGEVDIVATNGAATPAQVTVAKFLGSTQTAAFQGPVSAVGPITGPGTVPIGAWVGWPSDTLPADGNWIWANGQAVSRTTYAALFSVYGTKYGTGDGSTTFNVLNMQEVVPVGKSGMGGATSPGHLPSISTSTTGTLGTVFGTDTVTLSAAQIPAIVGYNINTPSYSFSGSVSAMYGTGGGQYGSSGVPFDSGVTESLAVSGTVTIGYETIEFESTNTGGGAHNNVQPSIAMNYIIRAF